MTLRIRVEELGDEVRECLERGEAVEIVRESEVVGRIEPSATGRSDWAAYAEARRNAPPLDDDFERDMEEILRSTNRPVAPIPWE